MFKNIVFIFLLLLTCSKSFGSDFELDIDCSLPDNIFECTQNEATKNAKKYDRLVSKITKKIIEKRSEELSDRFSSLEDKWTDILIDQCEHSTSLSGGGSLDSTRKLMCYSIGYRARGYFLEHIYDDILSDR